MTWENAIAFLIVSTLSLMVALSWNDVASNIVSQFGKDSIAIYFIYAIIITIVAVAILWSIRSKNGGMAPSDPNDVEIEI